MPSQSALMRGGVNVRVSITFMVESVPWIFFLNRDVLRQKYVKKYKIVTADIKSWISND